MQKEKEKEKKDREKEEKDRERAALKERDNRVLTEMTSWANSAINMPSHTSNDDIISLENDDNFDDDIVSHSAAIPQPQHPPSTIGGKQPRHWPFSSCQESPTFGSRNQRTNFTNFSRQGG